MFGLEVVVLCSSLSTTEASEVEARLRLEAELGAPRRGPLELGCGSAGAFGSLEDARRELAPVSKAELKATLLRLGLELLAETPNAKPAVVTRTAQAPAAAEQPPERPVAAARPPELEDEPAPPQAASRSPWSGAGRVSYEYFGDTNAGAVGLEAAGSFAPWGRVGFGLFVQAAAVVGVPSGFSAAPLATGLLLEVRPLQHLSLSLGPLLSIVCFGAPTTFAAVDPISEQPGAQLEATWLSGGDGSGVTAGLRGRAYGAERSILVSEAELFTLSAWTLGASFGYRFAPGPR